MCSASNASSDYQILVNAMTKTTAEKEDVKHQIKEAIDASF